LFSPCAAATTTPAPDRFLIVQPLIIGILVVIEFAACLRRLLVVTRANLLVCSGTRGAGGSSCHGSSFVVHQIIVGKIELILLRGADCRKIRNPHLLLAFRTACCSTGHTIGDAQVCAAIATREPNHLPSSAAAFRGLSVSEAWVSIVDYLESGAKGRAENVASAS